ncbi:hypothetical protein PoB_002881900 [Plakobranchus ocellatus]|uniref:Uncharacterized protein n=1 Tax=Plakobranchus ocellatus TaxID=259542 RepID=A0AAV4A3Q4_9GAST|nr:hypothetical protein PoB_002881900 [Plakobranchus ocellatus]
MQHSKRVLRQDKSHGLYSVPWRSGQGKMDRVATDTGPPSGHGAIGGPRSHDRRVPADLKSDMLFTVPPTFCHEDAEF